MPREHPFLGTISNLEEKMKRFLTRAQHEALTWLNDHNGSGVFTNTQQLLAGGKIGPFMRSTWNVMEALSVVTYTKLKHNKKVVRCSITTIGYEYLHLFGPLRRDQL